jgi:hypothetical protein
MTQNLSDLRKRLEEAHSDPASMIHSICAATADAHMHDHYGEQDWRKIVGFLLHQIPADKVEAVLRSKYMRWSSDDGPSTLEGFKAFLKKNPHLLSQKALTRLQG